MSTTDLLTANGNIPSGPPPPILGGNFNVWSDSLYPTPASRPISLRYYILERGLPGIHAPRGTRKLNGTHILMEIANL